jgi:hypothetical protein
MAFQKSSISHNLMDLELLNEDNLMDNPNLRWMVFKVKQRAQTDYYDLVPTQVGGAEMPKKSLRKATDAGKDSTYDVTYNWPYDYLSFVEMIKLDAEVLYKPDAETERQTRATSGQMPLEGTPEAFEGDVIGGTFGAPSVTAPGVTMPAGQRAPSARKATTRKRSATKKLTSAGKKASKRTTRKTRDARKRTTKKTATRTTMKPTRTRKTTTKRTTRSKPLRKTPRRGGGGYGK